MNEFLKLEHTTEIADLEQLPGSSSILKLKFKKVFPSIHIFLFKTSGSTELVFTDYIRYMVQDGKSVIAGNGKDHYPYLTRPNVSGGDPRVSYQLPWWKLTFDSSYELIVITGWDLLNTTDEASGAKIQRFSFTTDKYLLTEPDVYLFQDKTKIKMNQNDIYQCYTVERQDNDKSLEKRATLFVGYNNFNRVEGDFTSNLSSILGREVKLHVVREVEYTTATNQVVKRVTKTGAIGNIGNFRGYKVDRDNVSKDTDGLLDGVINDLPKDRATFPFKVRLRIFLSVKTNGTDDQVDSTGDIPTGNGVTELCKPMEFKLNYHYRKSSGQGLMYFSNKIRVTELEEETEYDISSGNLELESITGTTPYFELMGYKIDTQTPSIDPSQDFEGKAGTKIVLTIYEFRDGARQSEVKKYTYETRNERDLPKFTLAELAGNASYQLEFSKEGGMDVKKTFILTIKKKTGEGAVAKRYGSGSHDAEFNTTLCVHHPLLGETAFQLVATFGGFHGNPLVVPTWKVSKHEPWLVGLKIPVDNIFGFTKKQKEIFEARFYLIPLTEDGIKDTNSIKILKYPYNDNMIGRIEDPNYGADRYVQWTPTSLAYYKATTRTVMGGGSNDNIIIYLPITELEVGKTYIIYPGFTHMNPDGEIIISDAIDPTKDDLTRIGHIKVVEDVLDSVVVKEFKVTEDPNPVHNTIKTIFNIKAELLTGSSGVSKNGQFMFFAGQINNYWHWNNTLHYYPLYGGVAVGTNLVNNENIYNSGSSGGGYGSSSYVPKEFMNSPYAVSIVNEDYFISKPGTFITDDTGYYKKNVTTIPTEEPKFNITFTPEELPVTTGMYQGFALNDNVGENKYAAIVFNVGVARKNGTTTMDLKDILDNVSNKNYGKGNFFITTTGTLELHNASNDIVFTKSFRNVHSGGGGVYKKISYNDLAHLGIASKNDIKTKIKKLVAKFNMRVDVPMMKIKPDGSIVYYTLTGECNYEKSVETALLT